MKKIVLVTTFVLIIFNCTDTNEREAVNYNINFKNSTDQILNITGYDNLDQLVLNYNINPNKINNSCSYQSEVFLGFSCEADSLVFLFQNGKGYSCSLIINDSNLCFLNKSPYIQDDFENLQGNTYEFEITQEDFNNAFDLP
jgi:hypothetical protein